VPVIRTHNLLRFQCFFLIGLGAVLLFPLLYAVVNRDEGQAPLAWSFLIAMTAGASLSWSLRRPGRELGHREGILLVVAAWVSAAAVGALPFYLSPHFATFTDAFFESMSGFSTTGATVLFNIEALPASLHLWRCMTQWLGGMGIILLGIAILPLIGVGGLELYRAEFSGARSEKLRPRIAEVALSLWRIYVALSVAEYILLRWAGMNTLDALCHTFSTMSSGGYSPRNESIAAFQSPTIEVIVIFFMIMSGINFTRHYRLFVERRPAALFGDVELRYYLAVVGIATLAITTSLSRWELGPFLETLRTALFQSVSIHTGTGFTSTDFGLWPPFPQLMLLALMFIGGSTGSTTGGLKVARIVLLVRIVRREFRRMVERHGVFAIRLNGRAVSEQTVQALLNLVYLAFLVDIVASLLLTATGVDLITSISAVAACMFNVGPGLGNVGPAFHYGELPILAKWVLSLTMLAGRLEFYTVLVLLTRSFWRR
jgi:trk system potassium uptake protein